MLGFGGRGEMWRFWVRGECMTGRNGRVVDRGRMCGRSLRRRLHGWKGSDTRGRSGKKVLSL
jgi:hypothetical protein